MKINVFYSPLGNYRAVWCAIRVTFWSLKRKSIQMILMKSIIIDVFNVKFQ